MSFDFMETHVPKRNSLEFPGGSELDGLSRNELLALLTESKPPSARQAQLAQHPDGWVRATVALHAATPAESLGVLAEDAIPWVVDNSAFNPNTPAACLQKLMENGRWETWRALAHNPALSEPQQLKLVELGDEEIHRCLADTTEFDSVCLAISSRYLDKAHAWGKAMALVLEPKTPASKLNSLLRTIRFPELSLAKLIARHPNCPEELRGYFSLYLPDQVARNPVIALTLLENPAALKPKPYLDWKLDKWLGEGTLPAMVANHMLRTGDIHSSVPRSPAASLALVQPLVLTEDVRLSKYLAARVDLTSYMAEVLADSAKESVRDAVARNPRCPPSVLARLAEDPVASVREAARGNPGVVAIAVHPAIQATRYANKGSLTIRLAMAEDSESSEILADLAGDDAAEVRVAVANNRHTDGDTLFRLCRESSESVRRQLAWSGSNPECLRILLADPVGEVRARSLHELYWQMMKAQSGDGPRLAEAFVAEQWEALAARFESDSSALVRAEVARRTTDEERQLRLSSDRAKSVLLALAENPTLMAKVVVRLLKSNNAELRATVAYGAELSEEQIANLSQDEDPQVRRSVYSSKRLRLNARLRVEALSHEDWDIRAALARQLSQDDPENWFFKLANDSSAYVRAELGKCCLTVSRRRWLIEHGCHEAINSYLTRSSAETAELSGEDVCAGLGLDEWLLMSQHARAAVRMVAARFTPLPECWQILQCDKNDGVRFSLAKNGTIPVPLLNILAQDDSAIVRLEAIEKRRYRN